MTTVTDVPRPQAVKGVRAALVVTVSASAMAGVIHAVAAREHDGDQLLLWMFALCAVAQVVWAAVVAVRPTRSVLIAGVVINGGAVLVWALTRTVGIPFIDSLSQVEPAGTQDFACALFAAASVGGAVRMLARPNVRVVITPVWASALAVMALLATVPALRAQHTYQHSGHTSLEAAGHLHGTDDATHLHDAVDHAAHSADDPSHAHDDTAPGTEGHDHSTDSGSTAHAHVAGTTDGTSHDHTTTDGTVHTDHPTGTDGSHDHPTDPTDPTDPGHEHPVDPGDPTGPIVSLADPRLTAAQVAVATGLIDGVTSALAVYPDVAAVEAAGYVSLGDGGVDGFEHYIKWSYLYDGIEMNPAKIESIVVQKSVTGPKTIVSGMYILNLGKTMADAPDLAGSLTTFHYHDDLCLQGTTLVGLAVNGVCASGVLTVTPPMLHVWLIPQPCGPFAGIEGFGEDCGLHEH
jgi:hypothetical protein